MNQILIKMDSNYDIDCITEIIELAEGLDYCNRHMEEAYKQSIDPALSEEQRNNFMGCVWESLDESLHIFSRFREMPATALLTCINILEHDLDEIGFPKTDEECRMHEATDVMKSHLQKILEETG